MNGHQEVDISRLSNSFQMLIASKELRIQLAKGARENYLAKYTIEKMLEKVLYTYIIIINRKK